MLLFSVCDVFASSAGEDGDLVFVKHEQSSLLSVAIKTSCQKGSTLLTTP
jgi:hypothetical protein